MDCIHSISKIIYTNTHTHTHMHTEREREEKEWKRGKKEGREGEGRRNPGIFWIDQFNAKSTFSSGLAVNLSNTDICFHHQVLCSVLTAWTLIPSIDSLIFRIAFSDPTSVTSSELI